MELRAGPYAIAVELNRLKILTRQRKTWDHSVVRNIISRIHHRTLPYDRFAEGLKIYVARKSPSAKNRRKSVTNNINPIPKEESV